MPQITTDQFDDYHTLCQLLDEQARVRGWSEQERRGFLLGRQAAERLESETR